MGSSADRWPKKDFELNIITSHIDVEFVSLNMLYTISISAWKAKAKVILNSLPTNLSQKCVKNAIYWTLSEV